MKATPEARLPNRGVQRAATRASLRPSAADAESFGERWPAPSFWTLGVGVLILALLISGREAKGSGVAKVRCEGFDEFVAPAEAVLRLNWTGLTQGVVEDKWPLLLRKLSETLSSDEDLVVEGDCVCGVRLFFWTDVKTAPSAKPHLFRAAFSTIANNLQDGIAEAKKLADAVSGSEWHPPAEGDPEAGSSRERYRVVRGQAVLGNHILTTDIDIRHEQRMDAWVVYLTIQQHP